MHSKKIISVQVFVHSNSLYYNILYALHRYTDKRGVKHYFGEKYILRGIKTTIFYIKVYENACVSVQVSATLCAIGSYDVSVFQRVNIIHL